MVETVRSANTSEGALRSLKHTNAGQQASEHRRRKRDYSDGETLEQQEEAYSEVGEDEGHEHKRRRSSNWPLPREPLPDPSLHELPRKSRSPSSANKRHARFLVRPSKFQEGSMNDRPSEKPPSMFTRVFGSTGSLGASMDGLMENYHTESALLATNPRHGKDRSPSRPRTHRANASTSSSGTAASRESGIFRFGRSIASSFNPANIWRSVATNWNAAKEEAIKDEMEKRRRELQERKARAELAYAELKKSGQLSTYMPPVTGSESYTTSPDEASANHVGGSQRDSGIQLDDVIDSVERGEVPKPQPAPRKSSFHFKSPSLTNLRKMKSESQFGSKGVSPVKESTSPKGSKDAKEVRKIPSKKDLEKRKRLVKRVSDLEARLEEAKRELDIALDSAPPVPTLPKSVPHSTSNASASRPRGLSSVKPRFVPGELPSLPSERLLVSPQMEIKVVDEDTPIKPEDEHLANEPHHQDSNGSTAMSGVVTETVPHPPSRPPPAPPALKGSKKRKSANEEDLRYKPDTDNDDDAEWEEAAHPTLKKKRGTGQGRLTKRNGPALSGSSLQRKSSNGRNRAPSASKATVDPVKAPVKVPVKDAPSKPTAFATPAHPKSANYGVRSPSGHRLTKRRNSSGKRSVTPHSSRGGSVSYSSDGEEPIHLVPDGKKVPPVPDLPPLVKAAQRNRPKNEEFEWPDDVF